MKLTVVQTYLIASGLIFVGLAVLCYQLWLKPLNAQIVELGNTLEEKKKELEDAKRIVAKYEEFKKREDAVQRELEWLQSRMPNTVDREKLVETINLIQERSGVVITNFQIGNPAARDTYSEVPVIIKFSSDFKGLLDFIYQTTLVNLYMTVRDIVVSPLADVSHPNVTLSAQMTVSGIQSK